MEMIIICIDRGMELVIEDPKFIPRVGEHIDLDFYPIPVAYKIEYDYKSDRITVYVS